MHTKTCTVWGLGLLAVCNLLLATSGGHGLINLAGFLFTYLVVGYLGTIVPILGVGWLSDHLGLPAAIGVFCTALAWLGQRTTPVIADA